jgi:hypothetical protein
MAVSTARSIAISSGFAVAVGAGAVGAGAVAVGAVAIGAEPVGIGPPVGAVPHAPLALSPGDVGVAGGGSSFEQATNAGTTTEATTNGRSRRLLRMAQHRTSSARALLACTHF